MSSRETAKRMIASSMEWAKAKKGVSPFDVKIGKIVNPDCWNSGVSHGGYFHLSPWKKIWLKNMFF